MKTGKRQRWKRKGKLNILKNIFLNISAELIGLIYKRAELSSEKLKNPFKTV